MIKDQVKRWIFIRGLGRHSAHWGEFPSLFRQEFPLSTVELIDLAGNGNQSDRESFLKISSNTEDLRRRSRLYKMGPVSLMTISMGSMVGMDWATRYPQEIEDLVMINTSARECSSFFERMRPQNYLKLARLMLSPSDHLLRERNILQMTAQGVKGLNLLAEIYSHLNPTSPHNWMRQIIAASQFQLPKVRPISAVLVLRALGDNLVNPICSERISEQWGVPMRTHPSANHDLPLLDSKWICEQIEKW